jgi:NAD(P)-dependent dehydrogenase (short-subunit alcohol dehydrogenase family)
MSNPVVLITGALTGIGRGAAIAQRTALRRRRYSRRLPTDNREGIVHGVAPEDKRRDYDQQLEFQYPQQAAQ